MAVAAVTLMAGTCSTDPVIPASWECPVLGTMTQATGVGYFYKIEGGGITQYWTGPIVASNATPLTDFDGGTDDSPMSAVCEPDNPNFGSYFSWKAVELYKDHICPPGWHVPTSIDFQKLDLALGGIGTSHNDGTGIILGKYLSTTWAGFYTGYVDGGDLLSSSTSGFYWSQDPFDATRGRCLSYADSYDVNPDEAFKKICGLQVRCIKD